MKIYLIGYAATLVAFLACDAVWLSLMGPVLYRPVLGDMALPEFRLAPAVVFYLLYVAALVYFAVRPGLTEGAGVAMLNAALFGVAAYATYDLTNQATLKNWSTLLSVADIAWGAVASSVAATVGRWAAAYSA